MRAPPLNLSRPIIYRGIRWFLVFSLVYSPSVSAQLNSSPPLPPPHNDQYGHHYNFDPTVAIVIVVMVCVFFFITVFTIFIRQCSESDAANNLPVSIRRVGLDPGVIEKFPVLLYSDVKEVKIGKEALECAICLSEFEDDEKLRLLPKCYHVFHPECIDEWLNSHITCPICRANLTENSKNSTNAQPQTTAPNIEQNNPEPQNEVAISVSEEQNRVIAKNRPPRSRISGKFFRSHSTGHSLVRAGENMERHTLRLPEELRTKIMANAKLKRAVSFDVTVGTEGSSRKGYRSGGEGSSRGRQIGWSERLGFLRSSPVVSRASSSVKSWKIDNEGDSVKNSRNLLASVKLPLNCMSMKVEGGSKEAAAAAGSNHLRPSV